MSGYLDDVGLGDTVPRLVDQIRRLETAAKGVGLHLNYAKCEVFGLTAASRRIWEAAGLGSGLGFAQRPIEDATLFGSPIHSEGVQGALVQRCDQLKDVLPRLFKMVAHEAFYLLKSCFAISRLLY